MAVLTVSVSVSADITVFGASGRDNVRPSGWDDDDDDDDNNNNNNNNNNVFNPLNPE